MRNKINHKYLSQHLGAYFDGELMAHEKELMEKHLKHCEDCRRPIAELESFQRQALSLKPDLSEENYWHSFTQKVMSGFRQENRG
ncbi:MAG: zf-HC2 domain-containing protein [Candidatus Aminicenantes bacterium]|nr:zf-HC2 domain-containing protein [Candidatus Aminicenantes bacterium]